MTTFWLAALLLILCGALYVIRDQRKRLRSAAGKLLSKQEMIDHLNAFSGDLKKIIDKRDLKYDQLLTQYNDLFVNAGTAHRKLHDLEKASRRLNDRGNGNPSGAGSMPEHDKRPEHSSEAHCEVMAAGKYVDALKSASSILGFPLWGEWSMREAFLAGITHAHSDTLLRFLDERQEHAETLQQVCRHSADTIKAQGELIDSLDNAILCACNALTSSVRLSGNDPETNMAFIARLKKAVIDRDSSADLDKSWIDPTKEKLANKVKEGAGLVAMSEALREAGEMINSYQQLAGDYELVDYSSAKSAEPYARKECTWGYCPTPGVCGPRCCCEFPAGSETAEGIRSGGP